MNLRKSDSQIVQELLKGDLYREKIIRQTELSSTAVDISLKRIVPKLVSKSSGNKTIYSLTVRGKKLAEVLINGDE